MMFKPCEEDMLFAADILFRLLLSILFFNKVQVWRLTAQKIKEMNLKFIKHAFSFKNM